VKRSELSSAIRSQSCACRQSTFTSIRIGRVIYVYVAQRTLVPAIIFGNAWNLSTSDHLPRSEEGLGYTMQAFTSAAGDPHELPDLNARFFIAGDDVRLHDQAHVLA
jgi:hypothetical protein